MSLSQEYQKFLTFSLSKIQRFVLLRKGKDSWKDFIKSPDDLDDLISNDRIPDAMIRIFLKKAITLNGFKYNIFSDDGHKILVFIRKHQNLLPFTIVKYSDENLILCIRDMYGKITHAEKLNFPEIQHSAMTVEEQQPGTSFSQEKPLDLSNSGPNWTNQSSFMHR